MNFDDVHLIPGQQDPQVDIAVIDMGRDTVHEPVFETARIIPEDSLHFVQDLE